MCVCVCVCVCVFVCVKDVKLLKHSDVPSVRIFVEQAPACSSGTWPSQNLHDQEVLWGFQWCI